MNNQSPITKITIIIPVLNEAETIKSILKQLINNPDLEVIVVDGGSEDNTVILAQEMGVKVIFSPPGRGKQMNAGATVATGDILLFLHADTQLPSGFAVIVRDILSDPLTVSEAEPQIIAGAFKLKIDGEGRGLRFTETMANLRSRFCSLPYGDQAIFLKASVFKEMGGFPDLPIMEDFELIRKLKRRGKIAIADSSVLTSVRRWQKLGVLRTTIINQLMIVGYFLGVPPIQLRRFYQFNRRKLILKKSEKKVDERIGR